MVLVSHVARVKQRKILGRRQDPISDPLFDGVMPALTCGLQRTQRELLLVIQSTQTTISLDTARISKILLHRRKERMLLSVVA